MTKIAAFTACASLMSALSRSRGIALLLLLIVSSTFAQSNGSGQEPGAPAGSYALSDFDTVNLYNGNLNFHLPLLGINGRGEAQMGLVLALDVNQWSVEHKLRPVCPVQDPECVPPAFPVFNTPKGSRSPLNLVGTGYGPGRLSVRRTGGFPYNSCGHVKYYHRTMTIMTFMSSDGTQYELRDQLSNGEPKQVQRPTLDPCSTPDWGFNRGSVFVSTDGTSATFISTDAAGNPVSIYDKNFVSSATVSGASGYLMLRDGSRYRIDGGLVRWMRDRNGNMLSFEYGTDGKVSTMTDSLNREVTFDYNATQDTITYKGFGGAARTIKIIKSSLAEALRANYGTTARTYAQLFPELSALFDPGIERPEHYNPQVRKSVILPDGRSYELRYNPYGDLARVELPTGGAIEYDYTPGSGVMEGEPAHYNIYREVRERRVYPDGETLEGSMKYSYETMQGTIATVKHCKGAAILAIDKHYYLGSPRVFEVPPEPTEDQYLEFDYDLFNEGREYKTESLEKDGVTVLRRVEHTWENRAPVTWWTHGQASAPPNDPRITQTVSTLMDVSPHLVTKQTFDYDEYNNRTDVHEYDFGNGQAGARLRHTHTDYLTVNPAQGNQNYATDTDIHIRNLPAKQQVFQIVNNVEVEQARTTFEYDKYDGTAHHAALVPRFPITGHDAGFSASYKTRGNVTAISRRLIQENRDITAYKQFDVAGNVVKAIDALGAAATQTYATAFTYTDNFGAPDGSTGAEAGGNKNTFAFATIVTNPLNHKVYAQYEYNLGKAVDLKDANGVVTSIYFGGALDRPTKVIRDAVNVAAKSQTLFTYLDAAHIVRTNSDLNTFGDSKLKSEVEYDGLGRTIKTRTFETGANYIQVEQKFDALGRMSQQSNPYRPTATPAETPVWTMTSYDDLGRVIGVKTPDNAKVTTTHSNNVVTVLDQAGKDRQSRTDALGRLVEVVEDPGTGGLNYVTTYSYDALDNLRTVTQGTQTRTFVYDSLSRLKSADNPESGVISYEYDDNGNLLRRTDARSVQTTHTYDELNRVKTKSYTDGTPPVTYTYDNQALPSGAPPASDFNRGISTGRLVAVTYGTTGAGNYYGYDALGRVSQSVQKTNGIPYSIGYLYNLAGALTSESYPSGRVVKTSYDQAGRISTLTGTKSDVTKTYASQFYYAPHGAVAKMMLGNKLWEHTNFNSRLQPTEIGLGISSGDSSTLKLNYAYGTTTNNGNVLSQTISVAKAGTAPALMLTQSYTYDELNRLEFAQEKKGTLLQWKQSFQYDRYGNRSINAANTTASLVGLNPAISGVKNRISQTGYSYDSAGNMTVGESSHTYQYDAENRMVSFDAGTEHAATYTYDGEGHRVKKVVGTGSLALTTTFIYDASGKLIAEYAPFTAGSATQTSYITADSLGSTRIVTNAAKIAQARYDFLPFGEEIGAGIGGRTTNQGYSQVDNIRQHFTGYERDAETGLDYAQARYYSSIQGRYTSIDPIFVTPERFFDPQQFNLYSYTRNNPLRFIDPTGERLTISGDIDEIRRQLADMLGTEDAAKRITFDEKTGTITVDFTGIDLSGNEGAALLSDAINSENVYDIFVGSSVETLGGQLSLTPKDEVTRTMVNLDNNPDDRLGKGKTDMDKPKKGVDDQIGVNYDYRDTHSESTTKLKLAPNWTTTFHELAEAYAKVEGNKQYAQAHQAAIDRETRLRDQRPYLKEYNPASGPGTRIDTTKVIIRK